MKKSVLIIVLVFLGNIALAQEVGLKIDGLVQPKKTTTVLLNSSNLETVTITTPRGQSMQAQVFVVSRNQDTMSPHLVNAINKGVYFKSMLLFNRLPDGKTVINKLSKVILSNYSSNSSSGQAPTETFYIQFFTNDMTVK